MLVFWFHSHLGRVFRSSGNELGARDNSHDCDNANNSNYCDHFHLTLLSPSHGIQRDQAFGAMHKRKPRHGIDRGGVFAINMAEHRLAVSAKRLIYLSKKM